MHGKFIIKEKKEIVFNLTKDVLYMIKTGITLENGNTGILCRHCEVVTEQENTGFIRRSRCHAYLKQLAIKVHGQFSSIYGTNIDSE